MRSVSTLLSFIQYGIVDVVTMVSEVADHQDILRSLGKTVLVKILVKKTVQQLDRDKRRPAGEIQDELNDQVCVCLFITPSPFSML